MASPPAEGVVQQVLPRAAPRGFRRPGGQGSAARRSVAEWLVEGDARMVEIGRRPPNSLSPPSRWPMTERELPTPEDDHDRAVLEAVAEHGWAVIVIPEDEEGPGYAFSVGLFHTLGQPEVMVMGLRPETAHGLVNAVGESMRGGQRFEAGGRYEGLVRSLPLEFVAVGERYYEQYLGYAR